MKTLNIIKIGGNILDDEKALSKFLDDFSQLKELKLLVHGGGKLASQLADKLNIETKMIEGRRITDAETLKVTTMVYAGWINKSIVAGLQARNCNAIGLSGADGKCMLAEKRKNVSIDYGFVGDILSNGINADLLKSILEFGTTPVMAPITCDAKGQLLNTNADTIASALAIALSEHYRVKLVYCFEKKGVLLNKEDENSVISVMSKGYYGLLKEQKIVAEGMIPKLDNAFKAKELGVTSVHISHADALLNNLNTQQHEGTCILN